MDCLFCSIAKKEISADVVFEDDSFVVFKDISPKAETHLLIITKKHIESLKDITEHDKELMGGLLLTAQKIAKDKKLDGYKLQMNVGRKAGQEIDHIHLHLLAND